MTDVMCASFHQSTDPHKHTHSQYFSDLLLSKDVLQIIRKDQVFLTPHFDSSKHTFTINYKKGIIDVNICNSGGGQRFSKLTKLPQPAANRTAASLTDSPQSPVN